MYKNILIPTDGSDTAEMAVKEGIGLAKAVGAKVYGLYVIDTSAFIGVPTEATWKGPLKGEGKKALGTIEKMAKECGVECKALLNEGSPYKNIIKAAKKQKADLIVMGTAGKTGLNRFWLGSVTEKVVRTAPCPVAVVYAGCVKESVDTYKNILIPTDGSDAAKAAVKEGIALAKAIGAKVYGLYVIDTAAFVGMSTEGTWKASTEATWKGPLRGEGKKALGTIEKMAKKSGVKHKMLLNKGTPYQNILKTAEKNKADLIIMGTTGKTGLNRFLLGSVTEKVVRTAHCPVVVVHK